MRRLCHSCAAVRVSLVFVSLLAKWNAAIPSFVKHLGMHCGEGYGMLCAAGVRGGTQQGVPALRGVNAACGECTLNISRIDCKQESLLGMECLFAVSPTLSPYLPPAGLLLPCPPTPQFPPYPCAKMLFLRYSIYPPPEAARAHPGLCQLSLGCGFSHGACSQICITPHHPSASPCGKLLLPVAMVEEKLVPWGDLQSDCCVL